MMDLKTKADLLAEIDKQIGYAEEARAYRNGELMKAIGQVNALTEIRATVANRVPDGTEIGV